MVQIHGRARARAQPRCRLRPTAEAAAAAGGAGCWRAGGDRLRGGTAGWGTGTQAVRLGEGAGAGAAAGAGGIRHLATAAGRTHVVWHGALEVLSAALEMVTQGE
eukprot:COSAG02_NODE_844_length_16583_cov_116.650267_12_plen_105_part_00